MGVRHARVLRTETKSAAGRTGEGQNRSSADEQSRFGKSSRIGRRAAKTGPSAASLPALVVLAFLVGGHLGLYGKWPIKDFGEVYTYLTGGSPWTRLTPYQVIANDLNFIPFRSFAFLEDAPGPDLGHAEVEVPGLAERRDRPRLYMDGGRSGEIYTLFAGLIDTEAGLHGALLVDADGGVVRQWAFSNEGPLTAPDTPAGGRTADRNVIVHGLALLEDGSVIASFDMGDTLARYDACGKVVWRRPIRANHSVSYDGEGHVWTWDDIDMVRVDVATGEIVDRIKLVDLSRSAPGKYILSSRLHFDHERGNVFGYDPFHPNDVEALPAAYADAYPMFEAGDLLVSLRSGNVIFVIDPDTRRIKWWMRDGFFAQHDPDWSRDGRIILFDNNTNFGASRILRIDPATKRSEILLDGEILGFYTDLTGGQEMRDDGSILLWTPRSGRVVEYDADRKLRLEFINVYDADRGWKGVVTEARTVPAARANAWPLCQ